MQCGLLEIRQAVQHSLTLGHRRSSRCCAYTCFSDKHCTAITNTSQDLTRSMKPVKRARVSKGQSKDGCFTCRYVSPDMLLPVDTNGTGPGASDAMSVSPYVSGVERPRSSAKVTRLAATTAIEQPSTVLRILQLRPTASYPYWPAMRLPGCLHILLSDLLRPQINNAWSEWG